jgi:hypothetical protein
MLIYVIWIALCVQEGGSEYIFRKCLMAFFSVLEKQKVLYSYTLWTCCFNYFRLFGFLMLINFIINQILLLNTVVKLSKELSLLSRIIQRFYLWETILFVRKKVKAQIHVLQFMHECWPLSFPDPTSHPRPFPDPNSCIHFRCEGMQWLTKDIN